MIKAGSASIDDNGGNARWADTREAWAAMLDAAPPPPVQPVSNADELERLRNELTDQRGVMRDLLADVALMKQRLGDAKLDAARLRKELAEVGKDAARVLRALA
jgi:hypothetical protein